MDWNNINIDKDTSGLGPIEYDQSKVPALIRKYADDVRTKTYGQEVREAQARNAELAGLIAREAVDLSNETKGRQDKVENQFTAVQQEMTEKDVISAPELIAARVNTQGVIESTLKDRLDNQEYYINVKSFGAVGNGITDDTVAIQNAIDYLKTVGGGTLFFPSGRYKVSTLDDKYACLWINSDNIQIEGVGKTSEIFTTEDAHVPIHVSTEKDLTVTSIPNKIKNFTIKNMSVKGTGNYVYYGTGKGRGILLRGVVNALIHDNFVEDISMNGITVEGGDGYISIQGNSVHNCKYTAINFNGRAYQSIISGNICSGSDGGINSVAIQATGHSIVTGNTVFGSLTKPENAGGIMWGEGNYHGLGQISNNLIKHCRYGIKAIYHGACNISSNTIINCMTTGGINTLAGATSGFTVPNSDNLIDGNTIINCAPVGIESTVERDHISNNKIINIKTPINPSSTNQHDVLLPSTTQIGIRVRGVKTNIIGNSVSGATRGLTTTIAKDIGVISSNDLKDNTFPYSVESTTSYVYATGSILLPERVSNGSDYREILFGNNRPTSNFYPLSSEWRRRMPSSNMSFGAIVNIALETTTSGTSGSGSATINVVNSSGMTFSSPSSTVIGVELDNGSWHWSTVQSITSNQITLGTAIPTTRTVLSGAKVLYNNWLDLPTI